MPRIFYLESLTCFVLVIVNPVQQQLKLRIDIVSLSVFFLFSNSTFQTEITGYVPEDKTHLEHEFVRHRASESGRKIILIQETQCPKLLVDPFPEGS